MIRCREIRIADLDAIADLLARGFARRSRDWWIAGLKRQLVREVPEDFPRFGYMLEHEGTPVGALLLIYIARDDGGGTSIRCNLSSWYVDPAYRAYAPMLTKVAQRHKQVTYVNISPARWTWPTIEAQGFRAYTITNAAQAAEVVAEAMSTKGPVVIEVRSDVRQTIDRSLAAASG